MCLLIDLYEQFGPRSGPTKRRAWSGSKLFDSLMVFLKEFFEKDDFEKKNQQTTEKKHAKLPSKWSFKGTVKTLYTDTVTAKFFTKTLYTDTLSNGKFLYNVITSFTLEFEFITTEIQFNVQFFCVFLLLFFCCFLGGGGALSL